MRSQTQSRRNHEPSQYGRRRVLAGLAALALAACGRPTHTSQPEPGFLRYHADDVVQALRTAGLSAERVTPMVIATATPDPMRVEQPRVSGKAPSDPKVEVEARSFVIDGHEGESGQIFIFDSSERLWAKRVWFARFPDLFPYVYAHENVLLKLDADLSKTEAERYKAALETLP